MHSLGPVQSGPVQGSQSGPVQGWQSGPVQGLQPGPVHGGLFVQFDPVHPGGSGGGLLGGGGGTLVTAAKPSAGFGQTPLQGSRYTRTPPSMPR